MFDGRLAASDRRRPGAGFDHDSVTAESVLSSRGVEQDDAARIAVMLQAAVKDRHCETAQPGVVSRIPSCAGDGRGPNGEYRAAWRRAHGSDTGTVIAQGAVVRVWGVEVYNGGRGRRTRLCSDRSYVRRAADNGRLRVYNGDSLRAGARVARCVSSPPGDRGRALRVESIDRLTVASSAND